MIGQFLHYKLKHQCEFFIKIHLTPILAHISKMLNKLDFKEIKYLGHGLSNWGGT